MKAVICRAFGAPESLSIEDVNIDAPHEGEVQIAVKAAGLNFADILMVQGLYQVKPPFPFSPGLEIAGEVAAVAKGVQHVKVGDRVLAVVNYGGFAERVNAPAALVMPIPVDMDFEAAAAFAVNYGTSHIALWHRAALQPGERLLVGGAAGGVGLTAVEIGSLMGADVIACASTDEKLALSREYGAQHLINYSTTSVRDQVKALTEGAGVDVVYDPVGGEFFSDAVRSLAWEGRYLVVGFASGEIPEMAVNRVLLKNSAMMGVYWGAYAWNNPSAMHRSFNILFEWYRAGSLNPHISHIFPVDEVAEAMKIIIKRLSTGKVVLSF